MEAACDLEGLALRATAGTFRNRSRCTLVAASRTPRSSSTDGALQAIRAGAHYFESAAV
jgi:hypothetical protein